MCVATGGGWAGGGARLGVGRGAGRTGTGRTGRADVTVAALFQVPVREPAQQPGDISTFLGSCSHDDAATRRYTRIPGSMTGIHTHPSISGAAADRHQPSTRPSPVPVSQPTQQLEDTRASPATRHKCAPQSDTLHQPTDRTTRIPAHSPVPVRNSWNVSSECPDEHIPLPGIHRQRMRTWQQQRYVTGTMLTHTVDDRHVSCLCSRWEQSGVAGAALPRLDRLACQALAAAGLLDVQHQLQHITGRQLPAEPI